MSRASSSAAPVCPRDVPGRRLQALMSSISTAKADQRSNAARTVNSASSRVSPRSGRLWPAWFRAGVVATTLAKASDRYSSSGRETVSGVANGRESFVASGRGSSITDCGASRAIAATGRAASNALSPGRGPTGWQRRGDSFRHRRRRPPRKFTCKDKAVWRTRSPVLLGGAADVVRGRGDHPPRLTNRATFTQP
jgi:hypothetical protein